jgi:hypothetical protein
MKLVFRISVYEVILYHFHIHTFIRTIYSIISFFGLVLNIQPWKNIRSLSQKYMHV